MFLPQKKVGELKIFLEVMDVYYLMAMVSQVYTYIHTHQIVHVKYVQFLYINYTSVKLFKKEAQ